VGDYMRETTISELVDRLATLVSERIFTQLEEKLENFKPQEMKVTPKIVTPSESDNGEVFLTTSELTKKLKISRVTIWRLQQKGRFPKARNVSFHKPVWFKSEIEEWMRNQ
jgi:predicted DNA-binding transcriptional regulator AlpA